jgi:hypothetical protein
MPLVNDAPLSAEARELAAGSYRWAFRVCHDLLRRDAYRGMDREIAEGAALYGLCLATRPWARGRPTPPGGSRARSATRPGSGSGVG